MVSFNMPFMQHKVYYCTLATQVKERQRNDKGTTKERQFDNVVFSLGLSRFGNSHLALFFFLISCTTFLLPRRYSCKKTYLNLLDMYSVLH